MDPTNFLIDDCTGDYIGKIVDSADPEFEGRCRIEVYSKFDGLAKTVLPWASPINNLMFAGKNGYGNISIPRNDTEVRVKFLNGNIYQPEFYTIHHMNEDLKKELKSSYTNATALAWDSDENWKIYYTQQKGLIIRVKDSTINIQANSDILIEHKDSSSMIEMAGSNININTDSQFNVTAGSQSEIESPTIKINGKKTEIGSNPIFKSVNGEPLMTVLKAMATAIDAKMPLSPSVTLSVVETGEQLILSSTVTTSP